MKTIFAIFAIALFLCLPVFGQDEVTEVVLPDVVMKQVVRRIVIEHFKSKRGGEILFAEREIKPAWLPEMKGFKFALISDAELQTLGKEVHFFKRPRLVEGQYEIDFGWGDPGCNATGETWQFQLIGDRIKGPVHTAGGWGSGCSR